MATETLKKSGPLKIVTLSNATKLAEQWVSEMNGSAEDETLEVESEGRLSGLGLGAKVPHESKVLLSNDPVERKLYAKLGAGKRKAFKSRESTHLQVETEDGDDEDLESSSAFAKKRAVPLRLQLQEKKKQK